MMNFIRNIAAKVAPQKSCGSGECKSGEKSACGAEKDKPEAKKDDKDGGCCGGHCH